MNESLSDAIAAATRELTKRQRKLLKALLVNKTSLEEIAKSSLVTTEIVEAWIADARQRLTEGARAELLRAGVQDSSVTAMLEDAAEVSEALASALAGPELKVPSWLRDMSAARVYWTGPFSYRSFKDDSKYHERSGIYQIRCRHVVVGADTLVYIGRADTFNGALADHWAQWMADEQNPRIFLGELSRGDSSASARELLADVMALTIYWHSPAYNTKHISRYEGRRLIVQNLGQRGSLLPMYSSDWPTGRPDA